MLSLLLLTGLTVVSVAELPSPGISETLARERAAAVRALRYDLAFIIPDQRSSPVHGRLRMRFNLDAPRPLVLDFARPQEQIRSLRVKGRDVRFTTTHDHISVPADVLRAGSNELVIEFVAGDLPLNRGEDFLYTLFVPARAHLAFPCLDQPDLKARYTLSLDVPAQWEAVANAKMTRTEAAGQRRRVHFGETEPLPTYLFGFAAGKFSVETARRDGRVFRMLHRETDAAKVARNREAIFDLHASSLRWLERYTDIPYAFGKLDFVLIPSFQFGGMEHAGAIFYNSANLMLDESATQNQLLNRASLIAHETSHMWFGDLVTMKWFNDVWTKEVFANFMAAKIVNPSFPAVNHDLRFLLAHYPAAYDVDRTAGTNPIRQPLANLDEAGQLYGPIIYEKAPIVMRQLEMAVGPEVLRDGLRAYLKGHAFRNATWTDLIRILDSRTPQDLAAWSLAWVEERGRPVFTADLRLDEQNRVSRLALSASDPLQRGLVWPQQLRLTLGQRDGSRDLPVYMSDATAAVADAVGSPAPSYILAGGGGLGYGLFLLDDSSRDYLLQHLEDIADPLTRGSAWVTLWENLVEQRVSPRAFLDLVVRAVASERDEQNVQRILSSLVRVFWRYLSPGERSDRAAAVEATLRAGLESATTSSLKSAWFSAFRDVASTPQGLEWLEKIWRREEKIPGLVLAETDEIAIAFELAVRDVPNAQQILERQRERTQDPDRKARFQFVMPAVSGVPEVREQAFERFRSVENRRREPWVIEALQYLHHPLRQPHAERFIRPSLELLQEIQRTGDIFFPARWADATLGSHRSREAADTVEEFLAQELQYPQRLRWTILVAADQLLRATRAR